MKRYAWLGLVVLLFTALLLAVDGSVWAAPPASDLYQTVPNATATATNTPVPTATPVVDDEGNEEPSPTPTPKPTTPIEQIFETPTPDGTTDNSTNTDTVNSDNTAADSGDNSNTGNGTESSGTENSGAESNGENSSVDGGTQESAPEGQEAARSTVLGRVSVIVLNVREGPGAQYKIIGTIFNNAQVQILGRTSDNAWWQVCCALGDETPGWVDAQFVEPEFEIGQIDNLVSVLADAQPAAELPALSASSLRLEIIQQPTFAWQDQLVELRFVVTNLGDAPLANVEIRDDLPRELSFVDAALPSDGTLEQVISDSGSTIFAIHLPEVAAGERVTTTVTLQIATDVPDAGVINNLAVADAQNADSYTAGISIGMPPIVLPAFR